MGSHLVDFTTGYDHRFHLNFRWNSHLSELGDHPASKREKTDASVDVAIRLILMHSTGPWNADSHCIHSKMLFLIFRISSLLIYIPDFFWASTFWLFRFPSHSNHNFCCSSSKSWSLTATHRVCPRVLPLQSHPLSKPHRRWNGDFGHFKRSKNC